MFSTDDDDAHEASVGFRKSFINSRTIYRSADAIARAVPETDVVFMEEQMQLRQHHVTKRNQSLMVSCVT